MNTQNLYKIIPSQEDQRMSDLKYNHKSYYVYFNKNSIKNYYTVLIKTNDPNSSYINDSHSMYHHKDNLYYHDGKLYELNIKEKTFNYVGLLNELDIDN